MLKFALLQTKYILELNAVIAYLDWKQEPMAYWTDLESCKFRW